MAMKRAKIKSIPYEEFKDNETYEKLVEELNAGAQTLLCASSTTSSTGAVLTLFGH